MSSIFHSENNKNPDATLDIHVYHLGTESNNTSKHRHTTDTCVWAGSKAA